MGQITKVNTLPSSCIPEDKQTTIGSSLECSIGLPPDYLYQRAVKSIRNSHHIEA